MGRDYILCTTVVRPRMRFPIPRTPTSVHSEIWRFIAMFCVGSEPLYVRVQPDLSTIRSECFSNVRRKVERGGGRIRFGWAIWQCAAFFIEAEHHEVYETPHIGELMR